MLNHLMKKYALSRKGAKDLIWATLANICQNFALILPVGLLYLLVSDLLDGGVPTNHIWYLGVGSAVVLVLLFLVAWWQYRADYYATYQESSVRRITLAEKLRKLPLAFFGKKNLADLTTTIMGDCQVLETAFSHWIPEFFGSMISTVVIGIGVMCYDWRLGLASLWVLPISLGVVFLSKRMQNYFTKKQTAARLAVADGVQECLETMRDLKANNAETAYLSGLSKKIRNQEGRQIKSELGMAMFVVPAGMFLKLGIATVALVGGILLTQNSLSVLTFFAFLVLVARLYDPMYQSLQNLAAINTLQINIDRMNEINRCQIQDGTTDFNPQGHDITFEEVSFAYEDGKKVLDGVSFTAKQGEVTALIGESGGGKSTAAKLAARFYDPQGGRITLGGTDISQVEPETLLRSYAIVFQDVTLFNNTIMENIRIGKKDATDLEVLQAAKKAQCDEFVNKLPQGYQTMIGENGSHLSGGERQRISIARAILKDAPVILLDEATASLDAENETEIQKALSTLVKNKTVLIIAHRLRTVEGAEKIVVLQGGKVAEQGAPATLKKQNGIYAKMLKLQKTEKAG